MNDTVKRMHELACQARQHAYVPYITFKVGVCLRTENNTLFVGCNVQNSALPLGFCAESAAIASMITAGERKIIEIVIVADSQSLCTPCGGCRQQFAEFTVDNAVIHMGDLQTIRKTMLFKDLLPESFSAKNLG